MSTSIYKLSLLMGLGSSRWLILGFVLFASNISMGQKTLTWEMMAEIEYSPVYMEELGTLFDVASFSTQIMELEGQRVEIIGYLLPIDVMGDEYALSQGPFAACFFCGKSGPESVMELKIRKKENWFGMDRLVLFSGLLELNASDPNNLYYILTDAVAEERLDK
ncbi:MAG: hypothetical protein ACI959_001010 [Limisphaerales bacterium]|jgi:hypothetical protein